VSIGELIAPNTVAGGSDMSLIKKQGKTPCPDSEVKV
jgi:hypothetical protein